MLPLGYITHQIPHRTRLSIPAKKRDVDYFGSLEQTLKTYRKVEAVETNPLTGSVLIFHQGSQGEVSDFAKDSKLFEMIPPSQTGQWNAGIFDRIEDLNQEVVQFSSGALNIDHLTGLALIGLGLFQVSRRNILPPALTLIVDAFYLYRQREGALAYMSKYSIERF